MRYINSYRVHIYYYSNTQVTSFAIELSIYIYRYSTVETIQNLLNQSNSQSLVQWQSQVNKQVTSIDALFYKNGQFVVNATGSFIEKASLIIMGKQFDCRQLSDLLAFFDAKNVGLIRLQVPEVIENVTVMRFSLSDNIPGLKTNLDLFCKENKLDFALLANSPDWSKPGLVLMDMDSTTIQIECIDEIARLYGVGDQVAAVTAMAMQGKLDFNESLRTRVGKLEGAPTSILQEVADNLPLMPGLLALIKALKSANWKVAIASGGFTYFADRLKDDYGFDAAISNTLEIANGALTGKVIGEIINASVKERTLNELAERYNIPMSQTVAIGDGANDLLMLDASALGIAIHAKPIVQEKAAISINFIDLEGALCILSASKVNFSWS